MNQDTDGAIPFPDERYAAMRPFDPNYTFRDDEGNVCRTIAHPLDERYVIDPGAYVGEGELPPEELQIRHTLLAAVGLESQLSFWEKLFGILGRPSPAYLAAYDMEMRLRRLIDRGPTYRAAFCRLANSETVPKSIRRMLAALVRVHDASLGHIQPRR